MSNPLQIQPWTVDDFTGGITDNYLGGKRNQYQFADNLLITDERKMITRPGSVIYDETNYLPNHVVANPRVGALFVFEDQIFENSGRGLYYNDSGYTTLVGPASNPALPAGTSTSKTSWASWNKHLLITNDAFGSPMKVYKDAVDVFQVRNAGLPALASNPTVTGGIALILAFANDIKSKYTTHIASTAAHGTAADATNTVSAADATNLASLITLVTELLVDFNVHEKDAEEPTGWAYHSQQEASDHSLASVIAPTNIGECITKLLDLKDKFNAHTNDRSAHAALTANVTLADITAGSYLYTFLYYYTYTIGSVVFEDFGPTVQVQVEGIDPPNSTNVSIASIPTLSNGATENYDTSNIKVKIYRTEDGGLSSYYVGQVTNGTAIYTDSTSDTTLSASTLLYTDGGVYDNDPPPKAKYIVVANNSAWYLHVKEGSEVYPNRGRQSIQFDIDACPEEFFFDVEDEITGGGAIGIYPIVFCKERIYRIEGVLDLTGRGLIEPKEISRTVGCVSHHSIVQTRDGIFFAGQDGFYFTNGYEVIKISREFNTTYKSLVLTSTQKINIYGAYEALQNRVWWAVQVDTGSPDNDACFVADLNYGIGPSTPFTTLSGDDSFAPTALMFFENEMYRSDRRGYLFVHSNDYKTDPLVDTLANPDTWEEQAIIYDYKSAAFDFGRADIRKWVPTLIFNSKNETNVSIGINSYNDDSDFSLPLKEIKIESNLVWGDSTLTWGDPTLIWNFDQTINAMRRFPATKLRCSYKQVEITNSFTIIENSDDLGLASVDSSLKTVTLATAPDNVWPSESVGYFITFEADDYTNEYEITGRTVDVLTYRDALNTSVTSASSKWLLKGYRKGDVVSFLNYSLMFAYLSDTQQTFSPDQTGGNA